MAASRDRNPLAAYGDWLAGTADDWPEAALASAHHAFIDLVAVAVPGSVSEAARRTAGALSRWGDGPATVIGQPRGLAAPWAALANGTAGHALDFDDNFDPAKAHATTVLAPAILALAQERGGSGRQCLDAYIAGLQIMGRVGQGVNPLHRNRGWHATATVGALGAAAAGARFLKLDAERAAHAISMATSMAAGFMSQFGTMTKPLHAGLAAKAGVMAASLAEAGMTAGRETLDSPTGMNRLMVGQDYEAQRDSLTHVEHGQTLRFETAHVGEPLLILSSGLKVKRFPNCASTHRSLDGLLAIRAEQGLRPEMVAHIEAWLPVTHYNNLMHHDARTALEAKFSLEYALAAGLVSGNCTLRDFSATAVMRPEVRALYDILHITPVDKPEGEFPTRIQVTLKDGRRFEKSMAMPVGSIAAPFTMAQYWEKFDACVQGIMAEGTAARLRQALADLPVLPSIEPLMAPLKGPFPGRLNED